MLKILMDQNIKYRFLINKWKKTDLKHFNDSKVYIE